MECALTLLTCLLLVAFETNATTPLADRGDRPAFLSLETCNGDKAAKFVWLADHGQDKRSQQRFKDDPPKPSATTERKDGEQRGTNGQLLTLAKCYST